MKYVNHYLLASLFIVIFIGPMAFDIGLASMLHVEILFLIILISSVFLHQHNSNAFKVTVISLSLVLLNNFAFDFNQSLFQYVLKLLIISITIFTLFREIIKTQIIDPHIVSGAISIYILIGVFWYLLYMVLLEINPEAFHISKFNSSSVTVEMVYFSFTTLTTLGYGDITPVSYTAKMWSITEAVTGVMFIAVMISRLIALLKIKDLD
ncbi:MAG: hypothetical protein HOF49_05380 [Nitrosomonadales bacterium]|jgi:hypothetical protein|nr:hypothetical protein [Nitrosomonadales bacterium]MBT3918055.1 hypothetical protein [Nitrosomonadales bacterium]MBT4183436.1 hypothetical protein [Nitrosomonadales bacterium]MBT4571274.1 hypothetical protein [Nitrosomonadales bacterium]MBT4759193.1 hypothetical protein [Nitrosomonadales bacterium]